MTTIYTPTTVAALKTAITASGERSIYTSGALVGATIVMNDETWDAPANMILWGGAGLFDDGSLHIRDDSKVYNCGFSQSLLADGGRVRCLLKGSRIEMGYCWAEAGGDDTISLGTFGSSSLKDNIFRYCIFGSADGDHEHYKAFIADQDDSNLGVQANAATFWRCIFDADERTPYLDGPGVYHIINCIQHRRSSTEVFAERGAAYRNLSFNFINNSIRFATTQAGATERSVLESAAWAVGGAYVSGNLINGVAQSSVNDVCSIPLALDPVDPSKFTVTPWPHSMTVMTAANAELDVLRHAGRLVRGVDESAIIAEMAALRGISVPVGFLPQGAIVGGRVGGQMNYGVR